MKNQNHLMDGKAILVGKSHLAIFAAMMSLSPCFSTSTLAADLYLTCRGGGNAVKVGTGSARIWGDDGSGASASGWSTYDRDFSDTVTLEITGDNGRIRLPRTTLPILHGGDDGWMKLTNVEFTDTEIRATAKVNIINNPKVVLDRVAGTIAITGKNGDFSGRCQRYDPQTTARQF